MPPKSKSKQTKRLWERCNACECYISNHDKETHAGVCSLDKPAELRSCELSTLVYGFYDDAVFVGIVKVRDDVPEDVPQPAVDRLIYLHPATLRLIGCGIGQPVVVNGDHVFTAWPSAGVVPLTEVGVSARTLALTPGLTVKTAAAVTPLVGARLPASSVHVTADERHDFLQAAGFKQYVLTHFGNSYVSKGTLLQFSFYGQPCRLRVAAVTSEAESTDSVSDGHQVAAGDGGTPAADVSERLSGLRIGSSPSDATPAPSSGSCANFAADLADDMTSTPGRVRHVAPPRDVGGTTVAGITQRSRRKFYRVDDRTRLVFDDVKRGKMGAKRSRVSVCEIGGLDSQIETIRGLMRLCLETPQVFQQHAVCVPRGVLLYGPTGTGKTLLARAIISETQAYVVTINGPELFSKYFGESETKLANIFKEARKRAPSVVFLDELDSLCPRRDGSQSDVERRVVAALLAQLDAPNDESGNLFVIAATNKRDDIDPALRRAGRLDREIEIGVPTAAERLQILSKLLQRMHHTVSEEAIASAAEKCHGFVGADLSAICKEAGAHALARCSGKGQLTIAEEDLRHGMRMVKPSAMREVAIEVPQVRWSDIGGQETLKMKLRQAIEWPLRHPDAFVRLGITPPRGLLMYGPPGCSKTMIAKALARESGINFIAIKGPELFSKWVGESERAVREVFRRARAAAPAIVFFDEIDAIAGERGSGSADVTDRVLAQLLTEMDGVEILHDVTVVAATNRPDRIDKALLRPGRLDRIVYVSLPDGATRRQIFDIQFRKTPVASDVDLEELVRKTEGYSGAEIVAVCQEAGLAALQADMSADHVRAAHFRQALATVQRRTTDEMIEFYANYQQQSGLHAI